MAADGSRGTMAFSVHVIDLREVIRPRRAAFLSLAAVSVAVDVGVVVLEARKRGGSVPLGLDDEGPCPPFLDLSISPSHPTCHSFHLHFPLSLRFLVAAPRHPPTLSLSHSLPFSVCPRPPYRERPPENSLGIDRPKMGGEKEPLASHDLSPFNGDTLFSIGHARGA